MISSNNSSCDYRDLSKKEQETWYLLDEAIRKMITLSQFEKDLDNYQKLKEQYQ
jgi:hypothetical protein